MNMISEQTVHVVFLPEASATMAGLIPGFREHLSGLSGWHAVLLEGRHLLSPCGHWVGHVVPQWSLMWGDGLLLANGIMANIPRLAFLSWLTLGPLVSSGIRVYFYLELVSLL